jgi:hypothetical protein
MIWKKETGSFALCNCLKQDEFTHFTGICGKEFIIRGRSCHLSRPEKRGNLNNSPLDIHNNFKGVISLDPEKYIFNDT